MGHLLPYCCRSTCHWLIGKVWLHSDRKAFEPKALIQWLISGVAWTVCLSQCRSAILQFNHCSVSFHRGWVRTVIHHVFWGFLASTYNYNAMLNACQSWTGPTPGLLPFCRGLALRRSVDRLGCWATSLFEASQTNIRRMEVGREMPFQVWTGIMAFPFEEYKPEASQFRIRSGTKMKERVWKWSLANFGNSET